MGRLTEWVLDEALRQCASWHAQGHPVRVSVNISATNLLSSSFAGFRGAPADVSAAGVIELRRAP